MDHLPTDSEAKIFRKFSVKEFGIETPTFVNEIDPLLDHLEWDLFDVRSQHFNALQHAYPQKRVKLQSTFPEYYSGQIEFEEWVISSVGSVSDDIYERLATISPFRKRAMSQFSVQFDHSNPNITRKDASPYIQDDIGKYTRSLPRSYPESPEKIIQNPSVLRLVEEFSSLIKKIRPETEKLTVKVHPTSVVCRPSQQSKPSLEGIHSDGADYIVSALVVSRKGIVGGESIVYDNDRKTELLRTLLQPGEGIFQNDKHLFHDVTPIAKQKSSEGTEGIRNMIGFDFILENE